MRVDGQKNGSGFVCARTNLEGDCEILEYQSGGSARVLKTFGQEDYEGTPVLEDGYGDGGIFCRTKPSSGFFTIPLAA